MQPQEKSATQPNTAVCVATLLRFTQTSLLISKNKLEPPLYVPETLQTHHSSQRWFNYDVRRP